MQGMARRGISCREGERCERDVRFRVGSVKKIGRRNESGAGVRAKQREVHRRFAPRDDSEKLKTKLLEIIDSHAHLEFPQFDDDREAMLARARAAGVQTLLAIGSGTGTGRLDAAIPFAERHDWIYATVGIHPHDVNDVTDETHAKIDELARHPRV